MKKRGEGIEKEKCAPYPSGFQSEGIEEKKCTPYPLGNRGEGIEEKKCAPYPLENRGEGIEEKQCALYPVRAECSQREGIPHAVIYQRGGKYNRRNGMACGWLESDIN